MNDQYRVNLSAVLADSVSNTQPPEVDIIVFPNHITCYEKAAKAMDRKAHQLINDARAHTPLFPPKPKPTEVKYYNPIIISTAVVQPQLVAASLPIVVVEGISQPLDMRLHVDSAIPFRTIINFLSITDEECLNLLYSAKTLDDVAAIMYENAGTANDQFRTVLMMMNRHYTQLINSYLQATVDVTMFIDSFMEDYGDIIEILENQGFVEAAYYLSSMTWLVNGIENGIPEDTRVIIPSGTNVIKLDKTAEEMGFMEITSEFHVMLSAVYHPTLLALLDRVWGYGYQIPQAVLVLLDDTYVAYKSCVPGGTWSVIRA